MTRAASLLAAAAIALASCLLGAGLARQASEFQRTVGEPLSNGSRWLVDDPAQALLLRHAQLALAEGRLPVHDELVSGSAPPLLAGLLARLALLVASRPGLAPATDGVTEAALEETAARLALACAGLAAGLAAWFGFVALRGLDRGRRLLASAMCGAAFAVASNLREPGFAPTAFVGTGPLDPVHTTALSAVALAAATQLALTSRDATTITLAALAAGALGALGALAGAGLLLPALAFGLALVCWWRGDDRRRRTLTRVLVLSIAAAGVALGPAALRGFPAAEAAFGAWIAATAATGLALVSAARVRGRSGCLLLATAISATLLLLLPTVLGRLLGADLFAGLRWSGGAALAPVGVLVVGLLAPVLFVRACAGVRSRRVGATLSVLGALALSIGVASTVGRASALGPELETRAARAARIEALLWLRESSEPSGRWDRARAEQSWRVATTPDLAPLVAYHARRAVLPAVWLGQGRHLGRRAELGRLAEHPTFDALVARAAGELRYLVVDARAARSPSNWTRWIFERSPLLRRAAQFDGAVGTTALGGGRLVQRGGTLGIWRLPSAQAAR